MFKVPGSIPRMNKCFFFCFLLLLANTLFSYLFYFDVVYVSWFYMCFSAQLIFVQDSMLKASQCIFGTFGHPGKSCRRLRETTFYL